ncbi:MAG: ABC transporter ATP-binding protein [Chloroflexi bacterium]|nr:ABC transporter ATP-binding protein [Chloroflexota bacterium]
MVQTRKLVKEFRMGPQVIRAVDGVNLSLQKGKVTAIMGPSGCGKSTLMHLMGALERPTEGSLVVDGVEVTSLSAREEVEYRRRKVGFVFQDYHLLPGLTALENVALPMELAGAPRARQAPRAMDLLESVGLGEERHGHRPTRLSGGEQQRVAIARALANDPSLILADEPTGNLDSKTGRQIVDLLFRLAKEEGKTVVLVTHEPGLGRRADRLVQMEDGRIVEG